METLSIGELAQRCSINLETLRYYERVGLMPAPPRSESGHRAYPPSAIERLGFIRRAQALGFSLSEIAELFGLRRDENGHCGDIVHQIDVKVIEVEKKIADLQTIHAALRHMKDLCHGDCLIGDCPILESLDQESPLTKPSRSKRRGAK